MAFYNDEIEDIVGDIKYTDSQKSVTTSNVYSLDFTDSSSDKNNSSGKDTYVIDCDDSDDIDSDKTFQLHNNQSVINFNNQPTNIKQNADIYNEAVLKMNRSASASLPKCYVVAQETFTQTSKTIIELAETETSLKKTKANKTLETQTSFISVTENKTVEYKIEVSSAHTYLVKNNVLSDNKQDNLNHFHTITCDQFLTNALEDESSKFPLSESDVEKNEANISDDSSTDEIIKFIDDESEENILNKKQSEPPYENGNDFEISESSTDIEEDSFVDSKFKFRNLNQDSISDISEVPNSIDNDINDLYNKISHNTENCPIARTYEPEINRLSTLTPLTEESANKKESLLDLTPNITNISKTDDGNNKDALFTNNTGIKIKVFPQEATKKECLKLPPILDNQSSSNPHFFLFSIDTPYKVTNKNSNCISEGQKDRWEMESKELASGEGTLISGRSDSLQGRQQYIQLPPIHLEGQMKSPKAKLDRRLNANPRKLCSPVTESSHDCISINDRIKELKMTNKKTKQFTHPKYAPTTESKTSGSLSSVSPRSVSPDESRLGDVAERGCEVLCVELLRRLRSSSWIEVADTLESMSKVLEKFWGVITENRIADLIRHVCAHVDSPRTQVARSACGTLASIIKNTNYTKKPDFYEAVTILLGKTGSFSRPVRRAANVALDEVVCGVDLTHAVTALCVHGASHKSPLVRCAAARLLVVCSALSLGGRLLLRARPAAAAAARRHALRALAALLCDRSTDARKYAERLYTMLRPLSNFEAYYLTDVDVELASTQMKKYDQLLCGSHKEAR
ncbi:uncharacterized protein ACR2FA_009758 [Aphomia sociella]